MSRRCVAPVRTRGGVASCVLMHAGCSYPEHRRWDRWAPLLARLWAVKPWWPNRLGRAQDKGLAHTAAVFPCRFCDHLERTTPMSFADIRADHRKAEDADRAWRAARA